MVNPIKCIEEIDKVNDSIEGNDPRGWMKSCAKETLLKMGNEHDFKKCLIKKIESTKQHIENPKGYTDMLYNKIKGKCS